MEPQRARHRDNTVPLDQGRRSLREARTRGALVDAALELFAERGYDATVVDDIAELAGVSRRTFFRYFATKEAVLFVGSEDYYRSFAAIYLELPLSLGDLAAMEASYIALAPQLQPRRERIVQFRRAMASSAALRGRDADQRRARGAELAQVIARRRGLRAPDEDCDLLAGMCTSLGDRAVDRWLAADAPAELTDFVTDEFGRLRRLLAAGSSPPD